MRDPIKFLKGIHDRHGPVSQFEGHRGGRVDRYVFAFGPEYNRILHADPARFHSRGLVVRGPENSSHRRLSNSLFSLNGEQHQRVRHILLPAFQKSAMPYIHGGLTNLSMRLMGEWQDGARYDMLEEMRHWSWCITRKVLFGLDDSVATAKLRNDIQEWMTLGASPLVAMLPFNLPFSPYRRMLGKAVEIEESFLAIMRLREAEGCQGSDILSMLLRNRQELGADLSDGELVGHVLTLFMAAFDTTANTLAWTFFLLAQHPEAMHKVLDELAFLNGAPPSPGQLEQLPYLTAVLKESMRVLPAVVFSRRVATCDGEFGDYFLPQGSRVTYSHYLTHHMPELYPNPEQFSPERWDSINPSHAEYLPFGAGSRICLGISFAMFTLKTALALILPRWRMTVVPGARIDRHVAISLAPKHGMPMIVKRQDRDFKRSEVRGDIHEMVDLTQGQRTTRSVRKRAAA